MVSEYLVGRVVWFGVVLVLVLVLVRPAKRAGWMAGRKVG